MSFAHLHTHTEFSILDGSNKIKDYVRRVKALGMDSAAITDHGVMYGVIDFYKECKANDINPVLGCEVYVSPGSRFDREVSNGDDRYYHLILLAENNEGYQNLVKIVSTGFIDGFYYKPRVDIETLKKYHEGIICLSACLAGQLPRAIVRGNYDEARQIALQYQDIFGKDNYFMELQDHGIMDQKKVIQGILQLHQETGIPLVATNDCHYTLPEDAEPHDILLCIQTNKKVSDTDRMRYEGGQFYVKSEEEMRSLFSYIPEAIDNTQKIADRCNVDIEFGNTKLPHFEVPEGYDSWTYLNKLCDDGLKKRYGDSAEEHRPRLDYELDVIQTMGYVDYFLIVWDFINFARTHGIPVGPGRGSAAGSLVSYTTGITDIDPIRYSLIFERFLNPERVSMPDIDVDFDYERRSEVIDYVIEKYGKDCVTQIVTFGTMKARGVIRDVGRVLDLPYSFCDSIAKNIPNELGITIDKALEMNPELKRSYDEDENVHRLIDTAKRLEGLPRNTSMHAAGVVISQMPMYEYVPLARAQDGTLVTQYIMTTIEELGLLKMDFLGLRTLTVINDAIELANKRAGVSISVAGMTYDDSKVFELIGSGRTEGIFQLESAGMKGFMKELKPNSLEDVIAGISLYRPGPMDFIPAYIRGKNDPSSITYDCPELEPILSPTYGCIVYQEQVMQIVRDLAGYSMGRSDLVRRAMSKKKTYVMEEERKNFIYGNPDENVPGCVSKGIAPEVASKIYDDMIDFAKYAFNKSHAACYAVVAYQTAFLKLYYPGEFMAALMTSVLDNTSKVASYIVVCRQLGLSVLPPDINVGEGKFTVTDQGIRYGMYAIKNLGRPVVDGIVKEREERGEYTSLQNFLERTTSLVNKRAVENLIKAGATDCLEGNRRQKVQVYPIIMDKAAKDMKDSISGQMSLFDLADAQGKKAFAINMPEVPEFDKRDKLAFEKAVIGIYVSGHPLEDDQEFIQKNADAQSIDFKLDEEGHVNVRDDSYVTIGGIISSVSVKFTKNNQAMAFLTLEDMVGDVEIIVFPRDYEKNRALIEEDRKVLIRGKVSVEEDKDAKLICQNMMAFEAAPRDLWIRFPDRDAYAAKEKELQGIEPDSDGYDTVIVYLEKEKEKKVFSHRYCISRDKLRMDQICGLFGEKNVKVVEKHVEFRAQRA
jgi:DNA polymerase-3 subunit alpha